MKHDFQAIIFDLDGVIINSEEIHAQAKRITLNKHDIRFPENIFNDFKGRPDLDFWSYVSHELSNGVLSTEELDSYKRAIYFSLAEEIRLIPGVMEFLAMCRKKFRHMGLVTSATLPDLNATDTRFHFRRWFDLVLLGEDTLNHKPHPEPYHKALALLGSDPLDTIVIEDSPNGVIAAKAAGCFVIGIITGFTENELQVAGADKVLGSFTEIAEHLRLSNP